MTADEQAALLIVGNYGGKVPTTLPGLASLADAVASGIVVGWLAERDGYYLLSTAGEIALAAAIDTD